MNPVAEQSEVPDRVGAERIGAEALFRAHAPYVAGFVRRLGAPQDEVDDLVQEVFIVAHQKGGYVAGPARPQTWLSAIAIRLVRGRRRALARNREHAAPESVEGAATGEKSPAEALELRQSLDRVQAALDTLDVDARATFILYEIENVGCEVIASLMEVPVGTVYSRLHNARKKFLQAYEVQSEAEHRLVAALGGT